MTSTGSPSSTTTSSPPYYILVTQSSSTALGHPAIQYHYADDSPLNLLPQSPNEHVLLLDYDSSSPTQPRVVSTSNSLAVTGLKIQEAPGAAASEEKHNDRMYIIETTSSGPGSDTSARGDRNFAQAILAQFRQRNTVLRRALAGNGAPNTVVSPVSPSRLQAVDELAMK